MKKLFIILTTILIIFSSGCEKSSKNSTTSKEEKIYDSYIEKMNSRKEFEETTDDFNIKLITNKLKAKKVRYDIVIDSPKIEMLDIQAIAMVNGSNDENYPSIGILESNKYSLKPGVIDKANNIYKGVNLSGITKEANISIILFIKYTSNNKSFERYFKLNAN
ncbi:MAG: hypothetical protein PHH04_04360 [Thomasclavelia sp.]|nr:hypothetical protein [Thomasclavelia sp.]